MTGAKRAQMLGILGAREIHNGVCKNFVFLGNLGAVLAHLIGNLGANRRQSWGYCPI